MGFDPISAVVGTVLGGADTWYGQRKADQRQHQAQDFERDMFEHRYQMQVKDLKAAGLNPMLAYTQGPGGVPGSSAASATPGKVSDAFNTSRLVSAQEANIQADTLNKLTSNDLIEAQIDQTGSTADVNRKQLLQIESMIQKQAQEVKTLKSEYEKNTNDAYLKSNLATSEQILQKLYVKQDRLLKNQIAISDPKAEAARTTGSWAAHGRNISDAIKPITDILPTGHYNYGSKKYPRRVDDNE